MRAIERKLRTVLESKKSERLSKNRISEIISEFSVKSETSYIRPSIDGLTLNLLRRTDGISVEEIVNTILGEYPEKNREVLSTTTKRRLGSYLKNRYGVKITKTVSDDKTTYCIPSEGEAETIAKDISTIIVP